MNRCSMIIQGEGRGHYSQAVAAMEILENTDVEVVRVYYGKSFFRKTPGYFKTFAAVRVKSFYSPNFLRSADRKGIRVFLSVLLNLFLGPVYIFESIRLGILLIRDRSNMILNFYDPIGGLASMCWKRKARRITISHHFYLSHPDFFHPRGLGYSRFWLSLMNSFMMRSSDQVLALSYRKGKGLKKIKIIPPLIRQQVRNGKRKPGERDLCYFLNPGFNEEIMKFYRQRPERKADIFTDVPPAEKAGDHIHIHPISQEKFRTAMRSCRQIISTAGFDTVAEAFYLGIPICIVPSSNHYEQFCNALDAARTGLAFQLESLADLDQLYFDPGSNHTFKNWADKTEEMFLEEIQRDSV